MIVRLVIGPVLFDDGSGRGFPAGREQPGDVQLRRYGVMIEAGIDEAASGSVSSA